MKTITCRFWIAFLACAINFDFRAVAETEENVLAVITKQEAKRFSGQTKEDVKKQLGPPDDSKQLYFHIGGGELIGKTVWHYRGKGPKHPDTEKPFSLWLVFFEDRCTAVGCESGSSCLSPHGNDILQKYHADKDFKAVHKEFEIISFLGFLRSTKMD